MSIREKLEILRHKLAGMISTAVEPCDEGECCESCKYFHSTACTDYLIADYLIANGVTVQEQGRWTENQHISYDDMREEDVYWYTYTCSVCGGEAMNSFDYCPFCGNPMLPTPPKGE